MIKFGIRQSFDRIEQVEERYTNLNVPVEVVHQERLYRQLNLKSCEKERFR